MLCEWSGVEWLKLSLDVDVVMDVVMDVVVDVARSIGLTL